MDNLTLSNNYNYKVKNKELNVKIETSKFSFIKRKDCGHIDYISPVPSPFNYGSVENTISGDGDRIDVIVLGDRIKTGLSKVAPIVAKVEFYDNGWPDLKYICSDIKLSSMKRVFIIAFFIFFAFAKRLLNKIRGKRGITKLIQIDFTE